MRKIFFSFIIFLSFFSASAEVITLKTLKSNETEDLLILYSTNEDKVEMFFIEDFTVWNARYWFEIGNYGRKKIKKICQKAEEWAEVAKSENLTITKEFPFNEFSGDITKSELKTTEGPTETDICFYFVAKTGESYIKMIFKPCGALGLIKPPSQLVTLEDFRSLSEFLNAEDFKQNLKALRNEAKRKDKLLK